MSPGSTAGETELDSIRETALNRTRDAELSKAVKTPDLASQGDLRSGPFGQKPLSMLNLVEKS